MTIQDRPSQKHRLRQRRHGARSVLAPCPQNVRSSSGQDADAMRSQCERMPERDAQATRGDASRWNHGQGVTEKVRNVTRNAAVTVRALRDQTLDIDDIDPDELADGYRDGFHGRRAKAGGCTSYEYGYKRGTADAAALKDDEWPPDSLDVRPWVASSQADRAQLATRPDAGRVPRLDLRQSCSARLLPHGQPVPALWQAAGLVTANGSATVTQRFVAIRRNRNNGLGGRMDTHMDAPTWTTTAPQAPGLYHFACDETDDAWELVRVDTWLSLRRRHGTPWSGEHIGMRTGLYVDCPHLGLHPLPEYHDGLTSPRWRLIDALEAEQLAAGESAAASAGQARAFAMRFRCVRMGCGVPRLI